ncbi:MAG TPA: tetratricopeptide repeat protein [Candidatus Binatia bacterium]|nr:tetratricopeptide repeat protein [Candidatus Binatia bacterium]
MIGLPQQRKTLCRRMSLLVKMAFLVLTMLATSEAGHATTPQSFQQLSAAADRARERSRDDDAIQLYRQALALRPESAECLWYLGLLLYAKNQFFPARDALRTFVALRPETGAAWAFLGLSEFQVREYARALDHLRRAMATGMGDDEDLKQSVFYSVSILLSRLEQYDDSIGMLGAIVNTKQCDDVIIEADGLAGLRMPLLPSEIPQDRNELVRLAGKGVCAAQQGRVDDALKSFTTMRDSFPKEPGVHFLVGSFLMNTRPEEGIAEMKRELEISASHVPARNRLAEQYTKSGQYEDALKSAREAEKLEPKNFSVNITLGEALLAKGDTAEGIKELETARERAPENTRIRWDLARAYTAIGRTEDAKREKQELERLQQQNNFTDAKQE